jgi:hypothetical protein
MSLGLRVLRRYGSVSTTGTRVSPHSCYQLRNQRWCSTERSNEDVNRRYYTINNQLSKRMDILLSSETSITSPTDILEAGLEFELRHPLLGKYGIDRSDLVGGAPYAITQYMKLTGAEDFVLQDRDGPGSQSRQALSEFVRDSHVDLEDFRAVCRRKLGIAYVIKDVDVVFADLLSLKTRIVPPSNGGNLLYNFWMPESLLNTYPPGSVVVTFNIFAILDLVGEKVDAADHDEDAIIEKELEVSCDFIGCISGEVPLEWKIERLIRMDVTDVF